MRWALIALAACKSHPPVLISHADVKPPGMQLVIGDTNGVGLYDLEGKLLERWSKTATATIVGALPEKRGVVAMDHEGNVRVVRPGEDRVIGQVSMRMACGNEGAAPLGVKRGMVSADGRAACLGMNAITTGEIQVEVTIDLATGKAYAHKVGSLAGCGVDEQQAPAGVRCEPPRPPQVKSLTVEADAFNLVAISPTRRWEIYEGLRHHESSYESASLLFVDTVAKQRYAVDKGTWPAALQPGHKVTGQWASHPQITWLDDGVAQIDQYTLVELGKRVSLPGSFIRW